GLREFPAFLDEHLPAPRIYHVALLSLLANLVLPSNQTMELGRHSVTEGLSVLERDARLLGKRLRSTTVGPTVPQGLSHLSILRSRRVMLVRTYNVLTPCSPCVNEMPVCARLKAFGVCLIARQPSDDPSIRVAVVNLQQHVIVVVWDEVGLFERPVPSGCPHSQPRIGRRPPAGPLKHRNVWVNETV